MCFSPLLKSTLLATPNLSPPTVFDLGGWNGHHFVGNWVDETVTFLFFNIRSLSSKNMQHQKKYAKNATPKNSFAFQMFIIKKFEKTGMWRCAPSHGKWNKIIKFVLSVKLGEEIGFLQDPQKAYIFHAIRFFYVFQKKSQNKFWMGTHANYFV